MKWLYTKEPYRTFSHSNELVDWYSFDGVFGSESELMEFVKSSSMFHADSDNLYMNEVRQQPIVWDNDSQSLMPRTVANVMRTCFKVTIKLPEAKAIQFRMMYECDKADD
jgi:hypothetical protein